MAVNEANCPRSSKNDSIHTVFAEELIQTDVATKDERMMQVLEFLEEHRLALPRMALYRNLAYQGAAFSDSSLKNYLAELREAGYVARVDGKKFAEGELVKSDGDPGYWVITSDGVEKVEIERSSSTSDIDDSHL